MCKLFIRCCFHSNYVPLLWFISVPCSFFILLRYVHMVWCQSWILTGFSSYFSVALMAVNSMGWFGTYAQRSYRQFSPLPSIFWGTRDFAFHMPHLNEFLLPTVMQMMITQTILGWQWGLYPTNTVKSANWYCSAYILSSCSRAIGWGLSIFYCAVCAVSTI